jgi:DNA-binding transcriptional LysR family regulator
VIELGPLRYFREVVRQGSLSAAARALGVSQPTLTAAVKQLEERLGTTLLLRDARGVTPTASGRVLARTAGEVQALLDRAREEIAALESDDVGAFVVGCHESLGAYFLPELMRDLLERAPGLQLSLWNGSSAAVREAVLARQVHFGLAVNPPPHPDLVMLPLFPDAVAVFVSAAEPRPSSLAEAEARLARGPLILAGRVGQCQELLAAFAARGVLPPRVLDCGDLELVKSLALGGLGVALLPERVAQHGVPGGLVRLHPELPAVPDCIHLLFRGDLHRTGAALKVKDALLARGAALAGRR